MAKRNERKWSPQIDKLDEALRWRKTGRVLVTVDIFAEFSCEHVAAIFGVMAACPRHKFTVVTREPQAVEEFMGWLELQEPGRPRLEACWQSLMAEVEHHPDGDSGPLHTKRSADPEGPWPLPNVKIVAEREVRRGA